MKLKPTIMLEWNEDKDFLIDLFGRVRDEWMDNDLSAWMGANRYSLKQEFFSYKVRNTKIKMPCISHKS